MFVSREDVASTSLLCRLEGRDPLDHRLPQRLLGANIGQQFLGRHRVGVARDLLEPLLRAILRQHGAQIFADPLGERHRHARRSHQREEALRARDRGQRLSDRRRVGPVRQSLGGADRKELELATVDRAGETRKPVHDHLDPSAHHVAQAGGRAGIVDRGPFKTRGELDPFGGQVRDAAAAEHGNVDLARSLLHVVDELAERVDAERGRHGHRHRLLADEADGDEVAHQVVGIILGDLGQRDEARRLREQQRVSIGWCRPRDLHADRAGRAGMVGHEHLLAPAARQAVGHDPRDHVRRGARARGDDHLDRSRGVRLRERGARAA